MIKRPSFELAGVSVEPASRKTINIPVSILSDHTPVTLSAHVIHGRNEGPVMFISAGIHGNEVIGVEIVRRLLRTKNFKSLRGTLIVVPIVNTFGFLNHSRYLPDRRDLNRCFPGSADGSLGSRLAHIFMNEIVAQCSLGIDLHSAKHANIDMTTTNHAEAHRAIKKTGPFFNRDRFFTSVDQRG